MAGNQNIERAQQNLDNARQAGNAQREAGALLELGQAYAGLGLKVEAVAAFEEAITATRRLGDQASLAKALANAGSQLHLIGQHEEALELSRQAIDEFRGIGDKRGELRTLANCATIEQALGRLIDASVTTEQALAIAREQNDRELLHGLYGLHADLLSALDRPAAARSARQQAVQAARKAGNPTLVAHHLEMLGEQLLLDQSYDDSLRVYFELAQLQAQRKDLPGRYRAILQLGLVHQHRNQWVEAESTLTEALQLCAQLNDKPRQPYILASLASALLGTGKFDRAAGLAQQAAVAYRASGDPVGTGRSLASLGQALDGLGRPEDARKTLQEALRLLDPVDPQGANGIRVLLGV